LANRELGNSMVALAGRFKPDSSTVTQSVECGEKFVAEKQLLMSVD